MELRALEYFVAAADERHFTRAAAQQHVSQSGLSAAIKSLETELHAALFERTTRRVQLTSAGAALLPEARRALAAARAGSAAVSAVQGLQRGTVFVGVMQQMALVELPHILANYHRRYPGIELRLRQAPLEELHRMLIDGQLDLAVASPPDPPADRLVNIELFRTPLVLVCRTDDPAANLRTIAAGDLAGRDLVGFPTGWGVRALADRMAHASGTRLDFNLEVNDVITLLDLVEAGLGVALIPEALITRRVLRAVPLSGPTIDWTISALSIAPGPTNPAARELWTFITRLQRPRPRRNPRREQSAGQSASAKGATNCE